MWEQDHPYKDFSKEIKNKVHLHLSVNTGYSPPQLISFFLEVLLSTN